MRDPNTTLITALTHSGFKMARPVARKIWAPLMERFPESVYSSNDPLIRDALERVGAVAEELAQLEEQGVWALTLLEESYPARWRERLGTRGPAVVFGKGDVRLLSQPSIALLGSRDAPEASLEFTAKAAKEAVQRSYAIVSGGARGVDLAAVHAACEAGGRAVVVAADSLSNVLPRLTRSGCESDQLVVLTPNHPDSGFSVGQAMGRNKLVYGLAQLAVITACEEGQGGTWTGAMEALKAGWCPVGVWTGSGAPEGNRALARAGAKSLFSPEAVFEMNTTAQQGHLFT